jgi:Family of unknown function (DUF6325)
MADVDTDELGPVDYLVVEFPPGASHFTGEMANELAKLVDSGTIRLLDLVILAKDADGAIEALEIDDLEQLDELRTAETQLAELLAAEDITHLGRGHGTRNNGRRTPLGEHLGGAVRLRRPTIRRPAHRQRTHPNPGHPGLTRGQRRRRLTCHSDPHAPPGAASSVPP